MEPRGLDAAAVAGGPDVAPILGLHRAPDGFVTFHRKDGGEFRNLDGLRGGELAARFGEVAPDLGHDSYFSVNAFYRGHRSGSTLRYLNAMFVDLDVYNAGLTVGAALGRVVDLQDDGVLPPASMFARSGRGLWVFWLLRDAADPAMPQRAFPDKVAWYTRVAAELRGRMTDLAPDAYDAARVARVPGSLNPKSNSRVDYWTQAGPDGVVPTYTLGGLAALVGVPERAGRRAATPRAADDPAREKKRRGRRALYLKRVRQLRHLEAIRGGFADGCRNYAAVLCAAFALRAGLDPAAEVGRLADGCRPRLSPSACRGAVRSGETVNKVRDRTIADWLRITPAEAEQLDGWPPASWFPRPAPEPTRAERAAARRKLIQDLVGRAGGVAPPLRAMVGLLAEQGHAATPPTVSADYAALGFRNMIAPAEAA